MTYKTLRYRGHYKIIKSLYEIGQLTAQNIKSLIGASSSDVVYGCVSANSPASRTYREYAFIVNNDNNITAMEKATAFPAAAVALSMYEHPYTGVLKQETAVDPMGIIKKIRKAGVRIEMTETRRLF